MAADHRDGSVQRYAVNPRVQIMILNFLRFFPESLDLLSEYCDEFLIHAADVEGLCKGIDEELVQSKEFPTTSSPAC